MRRSEKHNEATTVHSSIALLQERFKELERAKEMRQEKQLLKMISDPNKPFYSHPMTLPEPTSSFSHPESTIPSSSRSPPQVSLTLWPMSEDKQEEYQRRGFETSNCSHTQSLEASWKNVHDCDSDSGVDTSLHL